MRRRLRTFLGFEKQSDYVKDYIDYGNMRSSVYMSAVIITLELWMICNLIYSALFSDRVRSTGWYIGHFAAYISLAAISVLVLVYSVSHIRSRTNIHRRTMHIMMAFAVVCVIFGIYISYADYSRGEQIFTFVSMVVFALCLLVWKPITMLILSVVSFAAMYGLMVSVDGASYATRINFLVMWICIFMASFSNFRLRYREAGKAEGLERINDHLKKSLMTDELTGIANMYFFREHAPVVLRHFRDQGVTPNFLYIDIENFKNYNESYGFHAGDELLRRFAGELDRCFGDDLVARISDDHFVALTIEDRGRPRMDQLRRTLHNAESEIKIELKVGVYAPECYDDDVNLACDRARIACQSTKKHSEKHYRFYDSRMEDEMKRRRSVVNSIDTAIEKGYIKVYYQPIIDLRDNRVCGMEALARWEDPKMGMLSPAIFIDVLEEYRSIHKLDLCIVDYVCRDLLDVIKSGREPIPVSVNFSRLDFELCDMVYELKKRVDKYGIDPDYIDVEITETALTESEEDLKLLIDRLHEAGFRLWLDDFGSGYSSLNVLKDYDFDVMKIDMQFLRGFENNERAKPILNNVVQLAKEVSMRSLTEGVETIEQVEYLRVIGCERAQGYYFAKPMQLSELDRHLKEKGYEYATQRRAV